MKHRLLPFILIGIGALATLDAAGKDVYVYSSSGDATGQMTDVKRIEFIKAGKVTLVPEKGTNVDIDIAKFGYITFKPTGGSGISSVETVNAILRLDGDILSVTSASEITKVSIYNVLGEMTGQYAPAANTATLTVNTRGLNIVVVEAGGISQTYKIVR